MLYNNKKAFIFSNYNNIKLKEKFKLKSKITEYVKSAVKKLNEFDYKTHNYMSENVTQKNEKYIKLTEDDKKNTMIALIVLEEYIRRRNQWKKH
uniref:Uncharacterized protein n=1 Tax=Theileria annulata TaxID=5874 RepID=A0A3B0N179_THEAN